MHKYLALTAEQAKAPSNEGSKSATEFAMEQGQFKLTSSKEVLKVHYVKVLRCSTDSML